MAQELSESRSIEDATNISVDEYESTRHFAVSVDLECLFHLLAL